MASSLNPWRYILAQLDVRFDFTRNLEFLVDNESSNKVASKTLD
jgi:hypothetical protein